MLTAFGKFLRKLRIDRLVTMKDMSDSLEVSVSYLSAVETGKRNIPRYWKDKIIEIYTLDYAQQCELVKAIDDSLPEISLKLNDCSEKQRDVALIFARRLEELDDERLDKLMLCLG